MHWCARLDEHYNCESSHVTITGATSRSHHQFLLNALACSVVWSPPTIEVAALLAFIEGVPWAPKPHVHLPIQRLALGSPLLRSSRGRAATCLHAKARLARGRGSWSLGHMMHQQAAYHWNATRWHTFFFCEMHNSFCEVSGWPATTAMENAPVEEQQPAPVRRQYVLVERTV